MNSIYFLLPFIFQIYSQNVQDYKKMIEEALSQQSFSTNQNIDIRIERETGTVEIISMGEENVQLKDNYQYPLEVGDTVKVGYNGEANIYINNFGIINLARNTEIEITETQNETIISLLYGTIISKIDKLKNKYSLKIKTPSAVCGVRGTQFIVEHNKLSNESIFGILDEGEIEVYPGLEENENNVYRIIKNQEIIINPASKRFKVSPISKLLRYKSKVPSLKKKLTIHKNRWKAFTIQEKIKFRNKLFNKKIIQNEFKKKNNIKKDDYIPRIKTPSKSLNKRNN
ncbi:MAG: FecR domain-containing protein [Elusimicrobiales bacterium]|nr:FecR domain-containing protein [Elusimicrobiales bacterium]